MFKRILISITCLLSASTLFAQLTGVKNIPGDYANLALAIDDLNAQGVGAGGVTFNLIGGNPQIANQGGYIIRATGTAANPIIFNGNNNNITAFSNQVTGSLTDGVFKIYGGDYITLRQFTIREGSNFVTGVNNNMTEWGIALLRKSTSDGAQFNTITNCTFLMPSTNYPINIYSNVCHDTLDVSTNSDIISASGANSYNKVYKCVFQSAPSCVCFIGSRVAAFQDIGNDVGGTSLAATGNNFNSFLVAAIQASTPFVSATTQINSVYMNHQVGENVSFNSFNNNINSTIVNTYQQIIKDYSNTPPVGTYTSTINNNTMFINANNFNVGTITCIRNQGNNGTSTSTVSINNNTFNGFTLQGSNPSINVTLISNLSNPGTLNIINTTMQSAVDYSIGGSLTGISNTGAVVNAINIQNNHFGTGSIPFYDFPNASTITINYIVNSSAGATCSSTISGNEFKSCFVPTTYTGTITHITSTAPALTNLISNNTWSSISSQFSSGLVVFINHNYSMPSGSSCTISGNSVLGGFQVQGNGSTSLTVATTSAASGNGTTTSYLNNNFSNVNLNTNTGTLSGFINTDGASSTNSSTKIVTGNTFNNFSPGNGFIVPINITKPAGASVISNNTITNIHGKGGFACIVVGSPSAYAMTSLTVSGNVLFNCFTNGGIGLLSGISVYAYSPGAIVSGNNIGALNSNTNLGAIGIRLDGSTGMTVTRNKIFGVNSSSNPGPVAGIEIASTYNFSNYIISNNIIGTLNANNAAGGNALNGINILGGATAKIYFNTIYLYGSNGAGFFGSSCVNIGTASVVADLQNNLLVNIGSANGGAASCALRNSTTTFSNIDLASDNNSYYCGSPSAAHPIYVNGAGTPFLMVPDYQLAASPRDSNSFTCYPAWITTTGTSPQYLHITAGGFNPLESAGTTIPGLAIDFDLDVRPGPIASVNGGGQAPDVGADEFDGTPSKPKIDSVAYLPNGSQCVASARTINAYVTPGIPLTSVNLVYSINNVVQTPIAMTGGSLSAPSNWTATIPIPTPTNATITFHVEIYDGIFLIQHAGGTYVDGADWFGFTPTIENVPLNNCPNTILPLILRTSDSTNATSTTQIAIPDGDLIGTTQSVSIAGIPGNAVITGISVNVNITHANNADLRFNIKSPMGSVLNLVDVNAAAGQNFSNTTFNSSSSNPFVSTGAPFTGTFMPFGNLGVGAVSFIADINSFAPMLSANPNGTWTIWIDDVNAGTVGTLDSISVKVYWNIPSPNVTWSPIAGLFSDAAGTIAYTGTNLSTVYALTNTSIIYTGTLTSPLGCQASQSVAVNVFPPATITASVVNPVICNGGTATGTVFGSASGFTWMPGNISGSVVSLSPTATTTYTVSGTTINGCITSTTTTLTVAPDPVLTAFATQPTICPSVFDLLNATGATSYSWNPGAMIGQSTLVNPTTTTTYTVTGTSALGCIGTTTVTVNVNPAPVVAVSASPVAVCLGSSTTLTATGATGYSWAPTFGFGSSFVVSPTINTTYTVTGSFPTGCSSTATITVNVNPTPTVTATTSSSIICDGAAATLTGGGATSYNWDPGNLNGTSVSVSPTTSTTYTVTGTDNNGCSSTSTVSVNISPTILTTVSGINSISCNGGSNGAATINATGGTGVLNYAWSPSGGINPTATNLTSGSYVCTITDALGCSTTQGVNITEPIAISTSVVSQTNVSCNGGSNGNATVTGSGGVGAFTYAWTSGSTAANENNLAAGTYSCTVTDGNGCTAIQPVIISEPTAIVPTVVSSNNATCNGGANGSATVNANGGTGLYTFAWSPSGGTNAFASGLVAGIYTVTITDMNACAAIQTVTITEPSPVIVNAIATQTTVCAGNSVTLTGSGNAMFYNWSGGVSNGNSFVPSATETFTVTGTNIFGCSNTNTITITVNSLPSVIATASSNSICLGDSVTFSGNGNATTYVWSGGVINSTPFAVPSSDYYQVTGTDANGCSDTSSVYVNVNALPIVNLGSDIVMCSGTTILDAGNSGTIFNWNDGSTLQTLSVSTSGIYFVDVTNANGCMRRDSIDVTINSNPLVNLGNDITQCGGVVTLDAQNSGATFLWNDNSVNQTLTVTSSGIYSVVATYAGGCSDEDTISITINSLPIVGFNLVMDTVCLNGGNFVLNGEFPSGGVWSGIGVTGNLLDPIIPGIGIDSISFSYTDVNGCASTSTQGILIDLCNDVNAVVDQFMEINAFPNPSNGIVTVSISALPESGLLEIVDAIGQVVYSETISNSNTTVARNVDLSTQANGVYFLRFNSERKSVVQKLMLQK